MVTSIAPRAQAWASQDPNPTTASYVKRLIEKVNKNGAASSEQEELLCLFPPSNERIGFGTAGLRSCMKPGPLGMNDLVVLQTAQGIARYVHSVQSATTPNQKQRVVIGYDHRANSLLQLSSLSFALISALVFEQAGMEPILLQGYVHTPLVAFAIRALDASVGIMITASHNPKEDNGYKVYWSDGCQIRPPLDEGISNSILQHTTPWRDYKSDLQQRQLDFPDDECLGLSDAAMTEQLKRDYFEGIVSSGLVTGQAHKTSAFPPPSFAYTAMHGVAFPAAVRIFQVFGLPPFKSVPSQQTPDATFSTVPFPNPEEKGALDLAKAFAESENCDVVFANDPDGDRLGVAERDRQTGHWTVFSGDQIGTMLGLWLWEKLGKDSRKPVVMCASLVSSKMLAEIARQEGFRFEETHTGFKYIGSRLETMSREHGYYPLFGYEEAIGFCCGNVFDKDGISALGVFAELAVSVYSKGGNLARHMQSLYDKYGEFVSNNGYYFCHDRNIVSKIIKDMQNGGNYMKLVAGYEVESIRDLSSPGYDSTTANKLPTLPTSASSPIMTISFQNGCVAQFRASGTEPKFKYYIEKKGAPGDSRATVTRELEEMVDAILNELLKPEENGLVKPQ